MKHHNEELKKANQELDNFVYRVSHDLKAPISSAKGLINIARNETQKARVNTCLELMQDSMDRLDSFILDILDYSRNSRTEINPSLIDFSELIRDTLAHTRFLQQESNIEIESEISDKISFYSDQQRLVFIFNNLISNAIRFADEEKKISFLKIMIKTNTDHTSIVFNDNGIGIPEEHLNHIFDMFYRANERTAGSGIGLYIVKEALDKLDGKIEVESKVGVGTTFSLSIPNMAKEEQASE
jgi:signal transduction histidine kinase